jgi:cell division protein FtsB
MKKIFPFITNKYLLTLAGLLVFLLFFDKYDLISQYGSRQKLNQLKNEKKYFLDEIEKNDAELNELRTNVKSLEKFGREKYLMKKEDEDIFVILEKSTEPS